NAIAPCCMTDTAQPGVVGVSMRAKIESERARISGDGARWAAAGSALVARSTSSAAMAAAGVVAAAVAGRDGAACWSRVRFIASDPRLGYADPAWVRRLGGHAGAQAAPHA